MAEVIKDDIVPLHREEPEPPKASEPKTSREKRKGESKPADSKGLKKGRKYGSLNYDLDQTNAMLDIVEQLLPYGAHHWAVAE